MSTTIPSTKLTMPFQDQPWTMDVSALMVLIGENQESRYRTIRQNFLECLNPAPITGLQGFLQHPEHLKLQSGLIYYSPSGQKAAPLRNNRLANAIVQMGLLSESRYTVLRIPPQSNRRIPVLLYLWLLTCTLVVVGLIGSLFVLSMTSWIGQTVCVAFVGWSLIVKPVEGFLISKSPPPSHITNPHTLDAVYILGESNSGLVLEGTREDVKKWTAQGNRRYSPEDAEWLVSKLFLRLWTPMLRLVSLLVLLLIFATIPNATTADQIIFIILNALGQVNVMLGQWLNGLTVLNELEVAERGTAKTRTALYAKLLRRFSADIDLAWVKNADLLPRTEVWDQWAVAIVQNPRADPKEVYEQLQAEAYAMGRAV